MSEIVYNNQRIYKLLSDSLERNAQDIMQHERAHIMLAALNEGMYSNIDDLIAMIGSTIDLKVGDSTEQVLVSKRDLSLHGFLYSHDSRLKNSATDLVYDSVYANLKSYVYPEYDCLGFQCSNVEYEWKVSISKSSDKSYSIHHDVSLIFSGDEKQIFECKYKRSYPYQSLVQNTDNVYHNFKGFLVRRDFNPANLTADLLGRLMSLLNEVGISVDEDKLIASINKDSISHSELLDLIVEQSGTSLAELNKIFADDSIVGHRFVSLDDLLSRKISFDDEVTSMKIKNCYETDEDRERQAAAAERSAEKKSKVIETLKANIDVDQTRIDAEEIAESIISNKSEIVHDARINLERNPIDDFIQNIIRSYASSSRYFFNVGSPYVGYFLKATKTSKRTYEFKIYKSFKGHFIYAAGLYMDLGDGLFRAKDAVDELSYRQIVEYLAESLNVDLLSLASLVSRQYDLNDFDENLEDCDDSIIYKWFEERFEKMTLLELLSKVGGLEEIEITNTLDLVSSFTIDFSECFK